MNRLLCLCVSCFITITALSQPVINWETTIDVASEEFGNKSVRMVLNMDGNPVVLHGKSGTNAGLYITIHDGTSFGTPIQIVEATNIYLNEAEGPRIAISGNRIAVSYQISGSWDNGAHVVISEDGGLTWGIPYGLAPNATEDHFMPVVAFDGDAVPFVGLKWKTNPTYEGIHLFNTSTDSFEPAFNAGLATAGEAVCECCPSNPFWHNGVYYDIVRNNDSNLRDMWLLASQDGILWDEAIDIDPTDWVINSCPATGGSSAILNDGTLVAAFMSGANGSRVYWSTVDLTTLTFIESDRIDPANTSTENFPVLSAAGDWLVATWERNIGGYDVMLAVSDIGPAALANSVVNLTSELSGHNRNPTVVFDGTYIHLAFKSNNQGTVKYMRGTISGTSKISGPEVGNMYLSRNEIGWTVRGITTSSVWTLYDLSGKEIDNGVTLQELFIPRIKVPSILKIVSGVQVETFKLID